MKIHQGVDNLPKINYSVVTSGTFDGVHVGHKKILKRIEEIAKSVNGESVVITFWPHPKYVLAETQPELKLLSTIEEKIELLDQNHVDHLIIIPFTKDFSQLTSEEFIQQILIEKIQTKTLVIGYDHRFGKNREGSFEYLMANERKYGFEIEEIPEQDIHDIAVSSTKIRNALIEGDIEIANEFLDRPYSLKGKVVEGDKIGRQIGFPTANLHIEDHHKLVPMDGIYAVLVKCRNKMHKGMVYIGNRPTLNAGKKAIETFILDFNETIYGEFIEVYFIKYIRGDARFINLDELIKQIKKDEEQAILILEPYKL